MCEAYSSGADKKRGTSTRRRDRLCLEASGRAQKKKGVRPPVLSVDAPPEGGSALLSRSSQYHRRARAWEEAGPRGNSCLGFACRLAPARLPRGEGGGAGACAMRGTGLKEASPRIVVMTRMLGLLFIARQLSGD